jgi:hypothetical protein
MLENDYDLVNSRATSYVAWILVNSDIQYMRWEPLMIDIWL